MALPKGMESYRDVIAFYDNRYYSLIEAGDAHAFLYPWAAVGALLMLLSMLVDYRRSRMRRLGSYTAFGIMCCFQLWTITTHRAKNPVAAYCVGLISSFGIMWTAAIVIYNDCQRDFQRIKRTKDERFPQREARTDNGHANGIPLNGSAKIYGGDDGLRQRLAATGNGDTATKGPTKRQGSLIWQSYPTEPTIERLYWVADVFCSFRGVGWNWQSSGVPEAPTWVQKQLRGQADAVERIEAVQVSKTGIRRFSDAQALLKACLTDLAIIYVVLDALKTLSIHDPYMWYGDMALPPPDFLPTVIRDSYTMTKSYRLLVCICATNLSLRAIFKMSPVFFVGILGPRAVGLRGEPWMNPADMFGDISHLLNDGLAGAWSSWWHQTFRYTFQQPGDRLMEFMCLEKRSIGGKLVSMWVAFFISGVLHAAGSYTQLGDTYPLTGSLAFFMVQASGVTAQTALVQLLKSAGVTQRVSKNLRRTANFASVAVWLYFTAPMVVDDLARGGIWLFEPVPISIFRGLGLGPKGEGWFCWHGGLLEWRTGQSWWDIGIAL